MKANEMLCVALGQQPSKLLAKSREKIVTRVG
jgi:hypothetical protein